MSRASREGPKSSSSSASPRTRRIALPSTTSRSRTITSSMNPPSPEGSSTEERLAAVEDGVDLGGAVPGDVVGAKARAGSIEATAGAAFGLDAAGELRVGEVEGGVRRHDGHELGARVPNVVLVARQKAAR